MSDHAPEPPPLRIGTVERESAARALDAHLEAGRLSVEEYADRAATAANATVAGELSALFTDLPAPHPTLPGAPAAAPLPAVSATSTDVAPQQPRFAGWGPRLVAVTPILALVLFLLFKDVFPQAWVFFLLIPVIGGVVYGGQRDEERDRRRLDRDERRGLRRGDD